MSDLAAVQIEDLFDRGQRPQATSARRSRLRNAITLLLLLLLSALIGGYIFITDPERVREISQRYLSELAGGPVHVGRANLSIFEGLRLDDIRIQVDDRRAPDSLLFEAKSLHISYDPRALLLGRIEATRILALEPRVNLVEDVDSNIWNFQRLDKSRAAMQARSTSKSMGGPLPEILLRSARIDYGQLVGGVKSEVGQLPMEGRLTPDAGIYRFLLQSRGSTGGVFPRAEGWLSLRGEGLGFVVRDIEFVDEIKTILPAQVRRAWDEHHLAGRIGETRVSYFRKPDGKAGFKVETDMDRVKLIIPPRQWLASEERARIKLWETNFTRLAGPVFGGSPVAKTLIHSLAPTGLQLDEVSGTFVFTDQDITVNSLVARIENNRFKLSGTSKGYDAEAPIRLRVESLRTENIYIPDSPRYISAMPWPVQEIYYRFRPTGSASFWVEIDRADSKVQPKLTGEVTIIDSTFRFDRFPYPCERANGILRFGNDPVTGREMLEIVDMQGHGYKGGANENAVINVSGKISPLDESSGADVVVRGRGIKSEKLLVDSMPPQTRKAIHNFASKETGEAAVFAGDFECVIHRPIGVGRKWIITTAIDVTHADGMLAMFPYPIKAATAKMVVYEDHIALEKATMQRQGGTVELSGEIDWQRDDPKTGEPIVQPTMKLTARRIPIDDQLLAALPEAKRKFLQRAGLTGLLDVDGTIKPLSATSDETTVDAKVRISNGAAKVAEGKVALTDLVAEAHIGESKVTISSLRAQRGKATVEGRATLDWTEDEPQATATAQVRGLAIDAALLAALPDGPRQTVSALQPEGAIDLDIDYAGASKEAGYRVAIRPRDLSLKPDVLPMPLSKLEGELVIDKGQLTLKKIVGRSGDAAVYASGFIDPKSGDVDVTLSGRDVTLTPELRKALSPTLQKLVQSVELEGKIAFDVTKLKVKPAARNNPKAVAVTEFAGTVWLQNAKMQMGVPMTDVTGAIDLAGAVAGTKLRDLSGTVSFDALKLAGRDVTRLTATMLKQPDKDVLQVARIEGRIADGQIAGQIDSILSDKDPRFGLSLVLRNAKVTALTGELDKPIDGRLTASLALEGKWDDINSRRGRGDVIVEGKEMYRVPLLFGFMQMANLTLPIDSPIHQAGVRYTVEAQRVTLEAIDLRSKTSSMQGTGWLDFGTKQVHMTLKLGDSPADSVPIFGDLIRGARQDLMQIRVRGTLEEPKVGASAFNTITTTVDEVLKGRE